ncbi:hypothetical protein CDR68_22860 [Salmonella enterica]|nr:hypothetical protein [Salmonella enterica]
MIYLADEISLSYLRQARLLQYVYKIRLDNDVQKGTWTGELSSGDKRHVSVSHSAKNALLFFERETKAIIPGKKMPGLHQAFQ